MTPYRTKEGDMVDAICKVHYGSETMARTVYEANPGLAAHGSLLPMGLVVLLPDPAPEPVRQPIRLWS